MRIKRAIEVARMFGWRDAWVWRTLFPPYRGWDIGCGYCVHEADALAAGRCVRSEALKHRGGCGQLVRREPKQKDGAA